MYGEGLWAFYRGRQMNLFILRNYVYILIMVKLLAKSSDC